MYMCKQVGLSNNDLEDMPISMCLDYIDEYVEQKNPDKPKKARQATQDDFDSF